LPSSRRRKTAIVLLAVYPAIYFLWRGRGLKRENLLKAA
jgi:hypothetical protein